MIRLRRYLPAAALLGLIVLSPTPASAQYNPTTSLSPCVMPEPWRPPWCPAGTPGAAPPVATTTTTLPAVTVAVTNPAGGLPVTGSSSQGLMGLAAVLVLTGGTAVVVSRRTS